MHYSHVIFYSYNFNTTTVFTYSIFQKIVIPFHYKFNKTGTTGRILSYFWHTNTAAMTRDKWHGHLAILGTNLIFGLNTPIAKSIVPTWISPAPLTLLRMGFAATAFWIIALFFPKEKVLKKDLWVIFGGALFGLVAAQLSFAVALQYTSPVNLSLIAAMTPVVVMLMAAAWLKEPVSFRKAAGVITGISGALLIIFHSSSANTGENGMLGNLLGVVNIVTYGLYMIITRAISQRYHPVTLMKWMFLFSALISLPIGLPGLSETPAFSGAVPADVWWRIGYVVVIATGLAYFLIPLSLKRIRPTTASMYNNLQPMVASTIAIVIGQDVFSWDKPVAAALVFTGVYLVTGSKSREDLRET